jgi:hypothetical protein
VDGAIIDSVKRTILENTAQIKILDCFTAYQRRQQLDGYDSEETEVPTPQARATANTTRIRGDALMPAENHLTVSIANGSQGVAQFMRWSDLLGLAKEKGSDIMVISEPG